MNKRGQIRESEIQDEFNQIKLDKDKKHKQKVMVYSAVSVFLVIIIASIFALFFYYSGLINNDKNDTIIDNQSDIPNPASNPDLETPSPNVSRGTRNNKTNTTSGTGGSSGGTGGTGETTTTCTPDCTNKQCGSDGCSGGCGTCNQSYECINYSCVFINETYPEFLEFFDNSGALIDSGEAIFRAYVNKTNGTVILNFNGNEYLAAGISNMNDYMVIININDPGAYNYYWRAYGKTEPNRENVSIIKIYGVNSSDIVYPQFSSFSDNNGSLTESGTARFNVTVINTNRTVDLIFNGNSYRANLISANRYTASVNISNSGTYNYYFRAYGNGTRHNINSSSPRSYVVKNRVYQCNDGIDNDNDGSIDYPRDFGCDSITDDNEINNGNTQCSNGIDDDSDTKIDQNDPDCLDRNDNNESTIITPVPENLVEMYNRLGRRPGAVWNASYLENPITYIWQSETLMYKDVQTGHEVWRMTNYKGNNSKGSSIYFMDIGQNAWSANGDYLRVNSFDRPTRAYRNIYDGNYEGQMITMTNGRALRFVVNVSNRRGENNGEIWSPQIPDTYYRFGSTIMGSGGNYSKLYRITINETNDISIPILSMPSSFYGNFGKFISGDGRKIIGINGNMTPSPYYQWYYPMTIYPDNRAKLDISASKNPYQGYVAWRNLSLYGGTTEPLLYGHVSGTTQNWTQHPHDAYYAGDGSWMYWMTESGAVWWRIKTLGSAPDGGALSDNSDFPVTDRNYDFGEVWPENHGGFNWILYINNISGNFVRCCPDGCYERFNFYPSGFRNYGCISPTNSSQVILIFSRAEEYNNPPLIGDRVNGSTSNATANVVDYILRQYASPFVQNNPYTPNKTAYWSHFVPDKWGRYALFSAVCDNLPNRVGAAIWNVQNHSYSAPSLGGGVQHNDWKGFTDYVVSSSPSPTYLDDKIYSGKYNDMNSRFTVSYTHTRYNGGGGYASLTRPSQSPDGTKVAWHSEFMNGKDKVDVFWSVVIYPYPAINLSASLSGGVKISFLPPKYTERGWPFANETLNKLRNGSWPELDSNGNEIGEPLYARELKKFHVWRAIGVNGPWTEIGTVDYLQNHVYHPSEDPFNELMMLHPVDISGYRITPLNKLSYTDNPGTGTYYYAITSEEYSGLESDELSEILQVTYSGASVTNSIAQSKGQKNFWRTLPQSPSNFNYYATGVSGHYNLTWTEPVDNKIRYYNIYYSNISNPQKAQQYRIASVPVGNNKYLDWIADPLNQGYYGISSVDRYGNEGEIVYIGGRGSGEMSSQSESTQSSEVFTLNPFESLINWFRQLFHLEPLNI